MADIAMLVAEEYERRVKNSRKNGGDGEEIDLFNCVSVFVRNFDQNKKKFGEEKMEVNVKWVLEPKSQVGFAAVNGFFSA